QAVAVVRHVALTDHRAGAGRGDEHPQGGDEVHRAGPGGGGQPQHVQGAADVGRTQHRVRLDEVDHAAVVHDHVEPFTEVGEGRPGQPEPGCAEVPRYADQAVGVPGTPEAVPVQV